MRSAVSKTPESDPTKGLPVRTTTSLNSGWSFSSSGEAAPTAMPSDWSPVDLPHTWNNFDGQDGGQDYLRGECFYAREFTLPSAPAESRFVLEFDGVAIVAKVWVNGTELVTHEAPFSRFRVDVTDLVSQTEANLLVVSADNSPRTDIYPQTADFTFYGGMYRGVRILAVHPTHFALEPHATDGVVVTATPTGSDAEIVVSASVTEPIDGDAIGVVIVDADGHEVAEAWTPAHHETEVRLTLRDAHRWQGVEDPYLYTVIARILRRNEVIDEIGVRIGVREFSVDPQAGFFLNGKAMLLRGVSRHQDRLGTGNALTLEDHVEDARLIRELGANTVRLAHYQHAQEFYDQCDELGLVVWAEIPFISVMSKDPAAHQNARLQMQELIAQNINHASILFWGISNEITIGGESPQLSEYLNDLNDLVKSLDDTRLTTMAQVSMLPMTSDHNQITDVLSYNHYFGWYSHTLDRNEEWLDAFHERFPDRAVGISEYGCEGVLSWHTENPQMRDYSETYQAAYHEHMCRIIDERPWLWSTHVWNMFDFGVDSRDEGGVQGRNNKGLVTMDRKIRKDAFYVCKAFWSDEPFVRILGRRFAQRDAGGTRLSVATNLPVVTLLIDGEPFATLSADHVHHVEDVRFTPGHHTVEVVAGAHRDLITLEAVVGLDDRYDLPGADPGNSVPNWFDGLEAAEAGELTFDPAFYSIRDTLRDLLANDQVREMLPAAASTLSGMKLDAGMLGILGEQALESVLLGLFGGDLNSPEIAILNRELQQIPR